MSELKRANKNTNRWGFLALRARSPGNRSFRYKVVSIQVVSIRTQAVKLLKNFDHLKYLKYSLRVNKKSILDDYSSFFKPGT